MASWLPQQAPLIRDLLASGGRSFSFEFKLDVVRRFLAGENKLALGRGFDLSSPKLIETWARKDPNGGEEGLRPQPAGGAPKPGGGPGEADGVCGNGDACDARDAFARRARRAPPTELAG